MIIVNNISINNKIWRDIIQKDKIYSFRNILNSAWKFNLRFENLHAIIPPNYNYSLIQLDISHFYSCNYEIIKHLYLTIPTFILAKKFYCNRRKINRIRELWKREFSAYLIFQVNYFRFKMAPEIFLFFWYFILHSLNDKLQKFL